MKAIVVTAGCAAMLAALAGCGGGRPAASGTTAATPDPVTATAARECAAYARIRGQITTATAGVTRVFELTAVMTGQGNRPWGRELAAAAKYADAPAIPFGHNPARETALALSRLALQLDRLQLDADMGLPNAHFINHDWNAVLRAQSQADAVCVAGQR